MDTLSQSLAQVGLEDKEYVKDTDTQNLRREAIEVEDGEVLRFLDSVDGYLDLLESLSSVLRQGWMELASARHSMGSSRISSALFDLKLHPASTALIVDQSINGSESDEGQSPREQQSFILSKWASSRGRDFLSEEEELGEVLDNKSHTQLRRRGPAQSSGLQENNSVTDESTFTVDEQSPLETRMRGASNGALNNLKKTEFEIPPIENKTSPTQTEVTRRTKRLEPHVMSRRKFDRVESDLARARDAIRKASKYNMNQSYISEDDKDYVPSGSIYRNAHQFHRSYLEMEKRFKIHVYEEGEPPLLHHGPCRGIYSIEGKFIHDIERRTPLRTRDPERAHVHFLPFSIANMVRYLFVPNKTRGYGPIKRVVEDYVGVISRKYPYWNRTLGADHFMLSCHDWGPESSKAVPDLFNHSIRVLCNANTSEGFNPSKDASLPEIKLYGGPHDVIGRALPPSRRPILAFFAGHIHGPVRPILHHHWKGKDRAMQVHDLLPKNISYHDMMSKSKFCLCPSGYEVASPRIVEAIYAGCVPVIMSDYYVLPFSDVLDYRAFSINVPIAEIRNLKKVLMGVSQEEYLRLYEGVREVKRHFVVNEMPKRFDVFHMILHSIWLRRLNVRILVD